MRCVLIDDERNNLENLQGLLDEFREDIFVAATAGCMEEGIAAIRATRPDIVFLDIQMPGGSGFDLLRKLDRIDFEVIFVTAYDKYGIEAIKFSALDYLLKPIDTGELKKSIDKARGKISLREKNKRLEHLFDFLNRPSQELPRISLPTIEQTHYVSVRNVIRCEASDNYTCFFLDNGEKILVSKTLKEFAELLTPYGFIRTHQSHLVNLLFVRSLIRSNGMTLLLTNNTSIPVSRQNAESVRQALRRTTGNQ